MIYCVDTSAWLDGWARDYPPDVFPSLWDKLAECILAGTLKCSEEVYVELEKKEERRCFTRLAQGAEAGHRANR
jgi:hypothetical protein